MRINFSFEDDDRCPGCRLNWAMYPPAKIHNSKTLFRCVECKRVYKIEPVEVGEAR